MHAYKSEYFRPESVTSSPRTSRARPRAKTANGLALVSRPGLQIPKPKPRKRIHFAPDTHVAEKSSLYAFLIPPRTPPSPKTRDIHCIRCICEPSRFPIDSIFSEQKHALRVASSIVPPTAPEDDEKANDLIMR